MTSHRTVFNHVGLCVADRQRSRRFYEGLLGFQFWWEAEPPTTAPTGFCSWTSRLDCMPPTWFATVLCWNSLTIRDVKCVPGHHVAWTTSG
ncbi:glyoxalase/Bleomycin resistance /Dioxygenase superfamily protein [Mycobacterium xenopi 4042]|uniref:Glyoxalase/Bleomycin resistance /Dioxygenase superfamily protein n=1 Tax=Mycobacterium xenopi 4042 TaxID=1299334 RepID=X8DBS0_MYCXE|nr:glyoxalase/Bleomycin resistance /Dioxygenase superfamily protein [Mycobacterium xenopi 4042]